MKKLREHGIIVTATHNHWLFDQPRLMYMHFESIDQPLDFARKVRDAMRVLITRPVNVGFSTRNQDLRLSELCDEFNDILGGTMHSSENGYCIVMKSRTNIKPVVLGRSNVPSC